MKIAIYGPGLMGGSLAYDFSSAGHTVTGIGRNEKKLICLKKKKIISRCFLDTDDKREIDVDVVFICLPVAETVPGLKKIYDRTKEDVIFCDIASVKKEILDDAEAFISRQRVKKCFIGLHPMAGNEKSGFDSAVKGLYRNAPCFIVKSKYSTPGEIKKTTGLMKGIGCRMIPADRAEHDRMVSVVSHIPHILSFGYTSFYNDKLRINKSLSEITAGSFKDMTRVSREPSMNWAEILHSNRNSVRENLKILLSGIKKIYTALESRKRLENIIKNAKLDSPQGK